MPWLDEGVSTIGLQLIILIEDDDHPLARHYHTTVQNSKYWKRAYGVRIPLHDDVPSFLANWSDNRKKMKISESLLKKNLKFLSKNRSINGEYPIYDYIDHQYIQYGLDGCLWEEFPKGIPGIIVDLTYPLINHPGWMNVWVTNSFHALPSNIITPCRGILVWDT
jgi:hypothetical protein